MRDGRSSDLLLVFVAESLHSVFRRLWTTTVGGAVGCSIGWCGCC